jgi:hypothetical protein
MLRVEGRLSQASLAYLWDHRIADRVILPAAAMLEMAAAAVNAAFGSSAGQPGPALTGVAIPAPLPLPTASTAAPLLAVALDPRKATLSVESTSGRGWGTYLRSSISFCCAAVGPGGSSVEARGLGLLGVTPIATAPSGFGAVVHRKGLQSQEYILDPAVLDNCTQVKIPYFLVPKNPPSSFSCPSCQSSGNATSVHT